MGYMLLHVWEGGLRMCVCVCERAADIDIPLAAEAEADVFKVSALSSQPGVPELQKREGERGKGSKGRRE